MIRWRRLSLVLFYFPVLAAICLGHGGAVSVGETLSYQGFGTTTPGGSGQPVYRVTTLNDGGSGSLRDAVSQGYRQIVFEVAGEIKLSQDIWVKGAFITIDGTTAPSPGITLKYSALLIRGSAGAHDVIVRGIRSREAKGCDTCATTGAGIGIGTGAYNVVIDRVSVAKAQDQALGMGKGAHDVTVQWSIFAESQSPSAANLPILISTGTERISFHHNLVIKGYERMPQVRYSDTGAQASDTQVDLRHSLIWNWSTMATTVWKGARANVVGNYYYASEAGDNGRKRAIYFCNAKSVEPQCDGNDPTLYARAYIAGNVSGHGAAYTDYLNKLGTDASPFPAVAVTTTDACTAARQVLQFAGVRPPDAEDQRYLASVVVTGCATTPPPPSPPPLSQTPPPGSGGEADAVEAEAYTLRSANLWAESDGGENGGDAVGMTHDAWAAYGPIALDEDAILRVRVASGNKGGTVTVRTASPAGPVLGKLTIGNTGGWSSWSTFSTALTPTTAPSQLYLTFTNAATGGGLMMLLDWFALLPAE